MKSTLLLAALGTVLLVAVINDIKYKKIPNALTFSTMLAALIYHSAINGFGGLLFSIEGIAAGVALLIAPYLMGGMGAGDAKLMGAVGGLLGPKGVFLAFLFTALAGGLYALALLLSRGFIRNTFRRYALMARNFFSLRKLIYIPPDEQEYKEKMRYGIAIAAGTVLSLFLREKITEIMPFI